MKKANLKIPKQDFLHWKKVDTEVKYFMNGIIYIYIGHKGQAHDVENRFNMCHKEIKIFTLWRSV